MEDEYQVVASSRNDNNSDTRAKIKKYDIVREWKEKQEYQDNTDRIEAESIQF